MFMFGFEIFFKQEKWLFLTVFMNVSVDHSENQLSSISFFRALTILEHIILSEVSFRETNVNGIFFSYRTAFKCLL